MSEALGTVVTVELFARTGASPDDGDDLDGSVPVAEAFDGYYEVEGAATADDVTEWRAWLERERAPLRRDLREEPNTAPAVDVYHHDDDGRLTLYRLVDHRAELRVVVQAAPGSVTVDAVLAALPERLDHDDFDRHETADI